MTSYIAKLNCVLPTLSVRGKPIFTSKTQFFSLEYQQTCLHIFFLCPRIELYHTFCPVRLSICLFFEISDLLTLKHVLTLELTF